MRAADIHRMTSLSMLSDKAWQGLRFPDGLEPIGLRGNEMRNQSCGCEFPGFVRFPSLEEENGEQAPAIRTVQTRRFVTVCRP